MKAAACALALAISACHVVSGLDDFGTVDPNGGPAASGAGGGAATVAASAGGMGAGGTGAGGMAAGGGACSLLDGPLGNCNGPGVEACYHFENNALDGSSNGLDASDVFATPAAYVPDGVSGAALSLAGNAALEIPQSSQLTSNSLTVAAWIRPSGFPPTGQRRGIVDHDQAFSLFLLDSGEVRGSAPGTQPLLSGPGAVTIGNWHHLAVSADGSNAQFYVDGVLVDSQPQLSPMPDHDIVYVGANNTGMMSANELFRGDIDLLVFHDVHLTQDQICGR